MTPLSVLDLVPIASGSTARDALRNSLDLVRVAEANGYARYWFAEHHLNPGVAGTTPSVLLAMAAGVSSTIRLGSGALLMGHRTALSAVEEFGLLDAASPGRFDLGLGRPPGGPRVPRAERPVDHHTAEGLFLPAPVSLRHLAGSPKMALQQRLLTLPGATAPSYEQQVADVLTLLAGTYRDDDGVEAHVVPGEGADVQVWVLGSSGGESARVAGERGLRFAANYHVAPSFVVEAVEAYRSAFRPSPELAQPYVAVSADVVVADDGPAARRLASGYAPWVLSIRSGEGAIAFPSPDEAAGVVIGDDERRLVADRLATQFAGTPAEVAESLAVLREAAGADELIVTTMTHDHADRVRSFELLAKEWEQR